MEKLLKSEQTVKRTNPLEILKDLGIIKQNKKGKIKGVYKEQKIEQMKVRKSGFDWIHLGNTDVKIKDLHRVLSNNPHLIPPRTGHMGNWSDIANGRAGIVDYNKTIIADLKIGYPLIYSNNQTEDKNLINGDGIYLPGKVIDKGESQELNLFTWDGKTFVKRDRSNALFTPFVLTDYQGELQPITKIHRDIMIKYKNFNFVMFDEEVLNNWDVVKSILKILIQSALHNDEKFTLRDIFAHEITLDGIVKRSDIQIIDSGFKVGETIYKNMDELINASKLPFIAASRPNNFFNNMKDHPRTIPALSKLISIILFSVLDTHYPLERKVEEELKTPFNPHFHWGALSLAGYPPLKRGTFANKDNIKKITNMQDLIVNELPNIYPTFFVLLPAAPFTLYPTNVHKQDHEVIEALIEEVTKETHGLENKPNIMINKVNTIVNNWLEINKEHLSGYFLNKFASKRSVLNDVELPDYSVYEELECFKELTFRQGCLIVGSLLKALDND